MTFFPGFALPFLPIDSFAFGIWLVTLKNESSRPWLPFDFDFFIRAIPDATRSGAKPFSSTMNFVSASTSGAVHFSAVSTSSLLVTSGVTKSSRAFS